MDDLLPEFLTETNESLAELDLALVKLEGAPDDAATLSLIFRMVHTIKGTCGFLGLPRLEHVAHAAENVLGRVRDGALAATPDVISLVLAALDRIKMIVAALAATSAEPPGDDAEIIAALNRVAAGGPAPAPAAAPALPAPPPAPPTPSNTPAPEPCAPEPCAPEPCAQGPCAPEPCAQEPCAVEPPAARAAEPAAAEAMVATQTIRVGVDVLEELMTLVGELVLTRNQLLQLSRAQEATALRAPLQRLSHITSDLQQGIMKTRMQPIGNAWNKLPRLVRDLAQETGKKIALEMRGQDTELDRQVLELMRDPLTHMVRNSADHGLETPDERRRAGKPETGRIMLSACHEGGHIIIEIADDGRGIDVARIRAKVLARGLATEAELAGMSDSQIRGFIFRAGFSTAETITAISGRGVGMDVVRTNIERIGGTVELASTFGQGSCFTVKIPLTLAIVAALIVQSAGERFAIPQTSVIELVRVESAPDREADDAAPASTGIEHVGATPVLRLRDRLLPLVSLASLLRLDHATAGDAPQPGPETTVVVTAVGSALVGIVVDEVFDTEEIVVKPVAPILRHVTMFGGNTILGDGSVIMILDPNGVARSAGISTRGGATPPASKPSSTHSGERIAMLLFRAGPGRAPCAVPLSLVARLESIPVASIERSGGGLATQYRGRLMPLLAMTDLPMAGSAGDGEEAMQPVLVFADGARSMGLMVETIIDIVHDRLHIELGAGPGLLGTAVVAGQAADVLDTQHWLTLAFRDWFGAPAGVATRRRVLVVEDSDFFRHLLVPMLSSAGYDVVAARNPAEALRLRDDGLDLDVVVSDIEMPGMDGLAFAQAVRQGGAWSRLPMIALSARGSPSDAARARAAGFTDYVQKSQREALMESLRQCLAEQPLAFGGCGRD